MTSATPLSVDERLQQLMEYTKFHIGMYVSLAALLIGVLTADKNTLHIASAKPMWWLVVTLTLFLAAGACGGLIASSIPDHTDYKAFMDAKLGPWHTRLIPARVCVSAEHTFFWVGVAFALYGTLSIAI